MRFSPRLAVAALAAALLNLLPTTTAAAAVPHTVVAGESLWSIAAANGMSVSALAGFNGLSADSQLIAGSTVRIPAASEIGAGSAPSAPTQTATATATATASSGAHLHPHPTNERLSARTVGDIGQSTSGMSRPLVQAVGWQESGFNNALVSSAGARGVMQIMPATWDFIQQRLAGGTLNPASAADNVRAGSLYLHHLYHLRGTGDGALAAYYQGPNRTTLLPETQVYVQSVRAHQEHFRLPGH